MKPQPVRLTSTPARQGHSPFPLLILAMLTTFIPGPRFTAAAEKTPADPPFREISAPVVKQLLEANQATLINVLSDIDFAIQHIPGSINIPVDRIRNSGKLPADRNRPIIVYCMGFK